MVRGRLAGGIGRARGIGAGFGEMALRAELAEHFIGRDMHEPEGRVRARKLSRGLKQGEGAFDIGVEKGLRRVDGAVDMAFGRQVEDHVRLQRREGRVHGTPVADAGLDQLHAPGRQFRLQRAAVGGIGHGVEAGDLPAARDQRLAQRRADEAGRAGDEGFHDASSAQACCQLSADLSRSDRCAASRVTGQLMPRAGSSKASERSAWGV